MGSRKKLKRGRGRPKGSSKLKKFESALKSIQSLKYCDDARIGLTTATNIATNTLNG